MKRQEVRSFSSVGRVSKKALLVVAGLLGLSGVLGAALVHAGTEAQKGGKAESARALLEAARSWRTENGKGCPSVSVLVEEGHLDSKASTDDAWGERLRVVCEGDRTLVRSPGPDREVGTADDVTLESAGG